MAYLFLESVFDYIQLDNYGCPTPVLVIMYKGVSRRTLSTKRGTVPASMQLCSSLLRWHLALQEIKHARGEILFIESPQIRHHWVHRAF